MECINYQEDIEEGKEIYDKEGNCFGSENHLNRLKKVKERFRISPKALSILRIFTLHKDKHCNKILLQK